MEDDHTYTKVRTKQWPGHQKEKQRGRTKATWDCTVEKERNKAGWQSWDHEVRTITANQEKWIKHFVEALLSTGAYIVDWGTECMKFGCMELSNLFMVMRGPHYHTLIKAKNKSGHFMKN